MEAIMVKACGFLFMIALGFVLKRIGLFSIEDSSVLSKIVLKITLPMAIVSNFKDLELNSSFMVAIAIGFIVHFVAIAVVLLISSIHLVLISVCVHCLICPVFSRQRLWLWYVCLM